MRVFIIDDAVSGLSLILVEQNIATVFNKLAVCELRAHFKTQNKQLKHNNE
jgi:hypothetical protein